MAQNNINKIKDIEEKASQKVCLAKEQAFNLIKQENESATQELEVTKQINLIKAASIIKQAKEQAQLQAKEIKEQTQQTLTKIEKDFLVKKPLAKKEILRCLS